MEGALTRQSVEREVKQKHVDARLTEEAKKRSLGMVGDKLANAIFRHIPRFGYPGHLEEGGFRRDVRVET